MWSIWSANHKIGMLGVFSHQSYPLLHNGKTERIHWSVSDGLCIAYSSRHLSFLSKTLNLLLSRNIHKIQKLLDCCLFFNKYSSWYKHNGKTGEVHWSVSDVSVISFTVLHTNVPTIFSSYSNIEFTLTTSGALLKQYELEKYPSEKYCSAFSDFQPWSLCRSYCWWCIQCWESYFLRWNLKN